MRVVGILLVVLLGLAAIVAFFGWGARGQLITRTQAVDEKWSQVQNVYQRRFDLVPNLIASVDNFMQRQQATLTDVIGMRQRVVELKGDLDKALGAQDVKALDQIGAQLSKQLNSFINVVAEQYPQIKGDQMYSDLMTQLEGTENRITQERRLFNEAVRDYNTYRQSGIWALLAGAVFGFPYEKEFFAASEEAQSAPAAKDLFTPVEQTK